MTYRSLGSTVIPAILGRIRQCKCKAMMWMYIDWHLYTVCIVKWGRIAAIVKVYIDERWRELCTCTHNRKAAISSPRLVTYLEEQRYRDDTLSSVKGIGKVVVKLRVEAVYLNLRKDSTNAKLNTGNRYTLDDSYSFFYFYLKQRQNN